VNIPVFYRVGKDASDLQNIDYKSDSVFLIPFVTERILTCQKWLDYIEEARKSYNQKRILLPIGLCKNSSRAFKGYVSEIRMNDHNFDKNASELRIILRLLREIYKEVQLLGNHKESKCNIFISHTKSGDDGLIVAEKIRECITDAGGIEDFFDCRSLERGMASDSSTDDFKSQILNAVERSTVIAVHSDEYSSRHWCQMEIICAKEKERPVIAIDIVKRYEDRRFPPASNVPCMYINFDKDDDILRAVIAAMAETIRYQYSRVCLEKYKASGWFEGVAVTLTSRPPELIDLPRLIKQGNVVVYPDPPMYEEEKKYLEELGVTARTPLTFNKDFSLKGMKIGISASPIDDPKMLKNLGQREDHLTSLSSSITMYILSLGSTLAYGGDFRKNSFAVPILEEAKIIKERLNLEGNVVFEYVSWPYYEWPDHSTEAQKWCGNSDVMTIIWCKKPATLKKRKFEDIITLDSDRLAWSASLTEMRKQMINDSNCRICMGGKCNGYKGHIPGVLEEIMIALDLKKPLFILGGFGGITSAVADALCGGCPAALSQKYHMKIENYDQIKEYANYEKILNRLNETCIDGNNILAEFDCLRNGLTEEENRVLFTTPYADEAIQLILKGLSIIKEQNAL